MLLFTVFNLFYRKKFTQRKIALLTNQSQANVCRKIKKLNEYREEVNLDYYIEVDGGINLEIARKVETAGGDIIVVGSAIIESKDKKELMKKLKNI